MAFLSWFRVKQRLGARFWVGLTATVVLGGCQSPPRPAPKPPPVAPVLAPVISTPASPPPAPVRQGDEIIVAGRWFHTGTTVVTWMDPGGYDAYQNELRLKPLPKAKSGAKSIVKPVVPFFKTYGVREFVAASGVAQPVRRGDLVALQQGVDQFVLHYDGSSVSSGCFSVLRQRGLSVHFLLDLDGTIYQTLDLEERALHATIANDRSVGIEIANVGAHPANDTKALNEWYHRDDQGRTQIRIPKAVGDPRIRTKNFVARPARDARVRGVVQGLTLEQYDFTPEQYAALEKLAAALGRVFPQIKLDCPRDAAGRPLNHKLSDEEWVRFKGILGHFHIQSNKQDPGPAFQWDKLVEGARELANPVRPSRPPTAAASGQTSHPP